MLIGVAAGVLSGLLGIGGGMLLVPLLTFILRAWAAEIPPRVRPG